MSEEHGSTGLEKRNAERVDLEVQIRWRHLKTAEADGLLHKGDYSGLNALVDPEAPPTEEVLERQAYTENLSTMGLKLVGDLRMHDGSALRKGWELLVEIVPDGKAEPIRALAEVVWITPPEHPEPREAGLFFKAINKEDVARVVQLQEAAKRSRGA
ncbi:MAG TPA: hypothetical protein VK786_05130 [bacterium]|jgi:hypothetical protein|nr:hypothetical protein [bacterium]